MSKLVGMFYAEKPRVETNARDLKSVHLLIHEILEMLPDGRFLTRPARLWLSWSPHHPGCIGDLKGYTVGFCCGEWIGVHSATELPTALCYEPDYSHYLYVAAESMASLVGCDAHDLEEGLYSQLTTAIAGSKLRLKSKS